MTVSRFPESATGGERTLRTRPRGDDVGEPQLVSPAQKIVEAAGRGDTEHRCGIGRKHPPELRAGLASVRREGSRHPVARLRDTTPPFEFRHLFGGESTVKTAGDGATASMNMGCSRMDATHLHGTLTVDVKEKIIRKIELPDPALFRVE